MFMEGEISLYGMEKLIKQDIAENNLPRINGRERKALENN